MPVVQRLELLDWMLSKGVQVTDGMPPFRFTEVMAHSVNYTDDERGEILDWFLRHGYKLDGIEAAALLLRQKQSVLPTWQKLIADGVLPHRRWNYLRVIQVPCSLLRIMSMVPRKWCAGCSLWGMECMPLPRAGKSSRASGFNPLMPVSSESNTLKQG